MRSTRVAEQICLWLVGLVVIAMATTAPALLASARSTATFAYDSASHDAGGGSRFFAGASESSYVATAVRAHRHDDSLNLAGASSRPDDARSAPRAIGPADVAVIGKVDDLGAATLRPGERTLLDQLQPNLGSPRLNYMRNDSVLRAEMGRGVPIRDVSIDPMTGALRNNTGFLRAERNILTNHDWAFDPKSGYWYPPG